MIPLKLELKNFLSYGEEVQTISFEGYPLICLSGRNGHGKSALLDAITWAIWGQARKVSGKPKADEGLLRLGQTQMMVILEFMFNGNRYRTRREFSKTYGKNHVALDFEVFNSKTRRFISLTDKTIRATQAKIEELIKLDFDTFVNSAFIRQGQSNEFSNKSPKERKEILGNILGLSKFDVLKQKSQEHLKKYQDEKKLITAMQEPVLKELSEQEEISKSVIIHKVKLDELIKKTNNNQKELEKLEKQKLQYLAKKQSLETVIKEKEELVSRQETQKTEFQKLFLKWREEHKQSLLVSDISVIEKHRKELLSKEKDLRDKQQKQIELQRQILLLKQKQHKVEQDLRVILEKEIFLEKQGHDSKCITLKSLELVIEHNQKNKKESEEKILKITSELETIKLELKGEEEFFKSFEVKTAQFEKRRAFYQVLVQRGNWLQNSLKELGQKTELARDRETPSCSLCEQVLTIKRKQFLMQKFSSQEKQLSYQLRRVSSFIGKLKDILLKQHEEIKTLTIKQEKLNKFSLQNKELNENLKLLQMKISNIGKVLLDGDTQKKSLIKEINVLAKQLTKKEEAVENILKKDKAIKEVVLQIDTLDKEYKALSYKEEQHKVLRDELNRLEVVLGQQGGLKEKQAVQDSLKNKAHSLIYDLRVLKKRIAECNKKIKEQALDKDAENIFAQRLQLVKDERDKLAKGKEEAMLFLGKLENELKRLEKLKEENKTRLKRLAEVESEISQYQALSSIFGKDGLQALLIEEAIPEIEDEANTILSRLTDNNSQILIESLRDLKKGGVKETLDIKISDSMGIRPYEMFSGGEAFRIDFSLRIAISKLLTRRSGTALQTLIIDEGFGSQDEEGLASLMDAIHVISRDFARIIVVSHLAAFKDNFPVHFMLEKFSSGSRITVSLKG